MFIKYKKLTIRNATSQDARVLCSWWNNGAIMAHAGFPNGLGTNEDKIIKELSTDSDDIYRRLILEVNNTAIGEMSYRNMGHNIAEIGIKICDATHQEKGNGTLFLKMLITELFRLGYNKIILDTNANNKRAQHVYENLGFKKLRVNVNSWTDQQGQQQSSVDYELIKSDFVGLE